MAQSNLSVLLCTYLSSLQDRIEKQGIKQAKSSTYCTRSFIIFFIIMQFRGIYAFKAQWRWLTHVANARLATATASKPVAIRQILYCLPKIV